MSQGEKATNVRAMLAGDQTPGRDIATTNDVTAHHPRAGGARPHHGVLRSSDGVERLRPFER
jgi:hypothetical protein